MIIYTDGGCRDNGYDYNVGSWSSVIACKNGYGWCYCQRVDNTTNNRTELVAIINTLKLAHTEHIDMLKAQDKLMTRKCDKDAIRIITDSGLCYKGWNYWINGWVANGWKTSSKSPVHNMDLWQHLISLAYHHPFTLGHCRGHGKDGDRYNIYWNNIADEACTMAMDFTDHDVHILEYDNYQFNKISRREDGYCGIYSSAGSKPSTKE